MVDVSEWAKREATRRYAVYASDSPRDKLEADEKRHAFTSGAEALAALLLSDKAVEAAARSNLDGRTPGGADLIHARDILEAAVSAVTTTERESEARND